MIKRKNELKKKIENKIKRKMNEKEEEDFFDSLDKLPTIYMKDYGGYSDSGSNISSNGASNGGSNGRNEDLTHDPVLYV